ncbi:MAG: NADH-quinone oxidoreductase subunit L, partial [Cyanobacteria bacterium REEB65]|nr:NADH-quinone oxidoreductase subunit L [Cyanobacteria bacterium REEB65]
SEALYTGIALGSMALVGISCAAIFGSVWAGQQLGTLKIPFLSFGSQSLDIAIHADTLSALMLIVVASVSFLVQLYSTSYMHQDPGYGRYFAFINLFTFAMLALVIVADLFSAYMCWELVGLGSYLLVGFWYSKPEAAQAAKKAFVVTRIGDFGFLLGILLLWQLFGTLDLQGLAIRVQHLESVPRVLGMTGPTALLVAMVLLFWGPIGKSAQFPLHVWLPDAMEGPTPVSALIHAATMVAAGVYLTARVLFLFAAAPAGALSFVGWIGGITALLAGSIAVAQWDIKRILAYSTISQLGYMMLALGFGPIGLVAAIFHLFNHAFFKALLFLGAGSVIHGTHTQDIREMGGLRKAMPWTFWPFTIATLSISGFPLLSGFWSKDAILSLAWSHDRVLWTIGTLTAGLTAFYMFRLWFYAFTGENRKGPLDQVHESPWQMTLPLVVLAIPSAFSGYWGMLGPQRFGDFLWHGLANFAGLIVPPQGVGSGEGLVMAISTIVALAGILAAWLLYGQISERQAGPPNLAAEPLQRLGILWTALSNKGYFDELYAGLRDRVYLAACAFWDAFDRYVVDGLVNLVALGNLGLGEGLRKSETGRAQTYLWWAIAGTTTLAIVLVVFGGGALAWLATIAAIALLAVFTVFDRQARA